MRQKHNRNIEDFATLTFDIYVYLMCNLLLDIDLLFNILQINNIRLYIKSSYHLILHYINSTFVSFDRCCTAIILLAEEDTSSIADVCI